MADNRRFIVEIIGENPAKAWGLTSMERLKRMLHAEKIEVASARTPDLPLLVADSDYIFERLWLRLALNTPGSVLTINGRPVLAHLPDHTSLEGVRAAMTEKRGPENTAGLTFIPMDEGMTIENEELRKREAPFAGRLTAETAAKAERATYYGAYKGVTDVLTKYLWPELALVLTRLAARIGMTPNMVTAIGAALCVYATWLFYQGNFWSGVAAGFVFMVLDTVDGKLARCTITSSKWGNVFDHGIDLVHPPFWWYAWGLGLTKVNLGIGNDTLWALMAVIVIGYVLQRLIEGEFIRAFGMHIHVWRKFDSQFRLITARRNPNMVILVVALIFNRPDIGLELVAWWTIISLVVHAVRLAQAYITRLGGRDVTSWLEQGT